MEAHTDIHSQTKILIFSVYQCFNILSGQKENPDFANFFRQTREVTAEA